MSEWFKEHDWKSCVRLKRTGGSNPLLCAIKKRYTAGISLFCRLRCFEEDSRVGAILREQNALPCATWSLHYLMAKDDVDNVGAGRAAKGENPLLCAKKSTSFDKKLVDFYSSRKACHIITACRVCPCHRRMSFST